MGFLEEIDFSQVPTVQEFYKGKTVFITGGSGFMGKVLLEKLLYSCTDLDRIYLLLRCKKGVTSKDRLKQIYASQCFDRLKSEKPNAFESKVCVIPGDVMEVGLGLSEEDRALLIDRVNIIFHVAASVRFNDPLHYAAKLNLGGTKQVVELAREIRNLFVLVHVSTSYSNTNRDTIEEVMYPPHADWRDTLETCEKVDAHTLRVLTPKYLGELPNTYTFTKQLAEHVVYEQRGQLPAVIVRPSIVISSVEEPVPGWIDNFNGPVSLLVASGKGIMRSLYTNPDLTADYMPVDVAIKHLIAAAWVRGTKKLEPTDDIPIYNCCAGNLNTISINEMIEMGRNLNKIIPVGGMLWHAGGSLTTSKTIHYVKLLLLHLLPAVIIDIILWASGRKPMLVKVQRRIYIANMALQYYLLKQWSFDNTNFVLLRSCLKEEDKKHFGHDIENVDRYKFFYDSIWGCKKYLLKEKEEDLPKDKAHARRMYTLDVVVKVLFYGYLLWWFVNTNIAKNIFQCVYDFIVSL